MKKHWFPDTVHRGCFINDNYEEESNLFGTTIPDTEASFW